MSIQRTIFMPQATCGLRIHDAGPHPELEISKQYYSSYSPFLILIDLYARTKHVPGEPTEFKLTKFWYRLKHKGMRSRDSYIDIISVSYEPLH